jgi:hypothetical protein
MFKSDNHDKTFCDKFVHAQSFSYPGLNLNILATKICINFILTMDDSSYRLNFDPDKNNENIIIALIIEHPNKLVKLPNLVAKCCKIRKI